MTGDDLHKLILILQVIGMIVTSAIGVVEFIIKNSQDRLAKRLDHMEDRVEGLIDKHNW